MYDREARRVVMVIDAVALAAIVIALCLGKACGG